MPVQPTEFRYTKAQFFDLEPIKTDRSGQITAIAVTIQGIVGSDSTTGRERPQRFRLLVDVNRLDRELPAVWIASPPDAEIRHVNVWPGRETCPFTGTVLPKLCWGTTPTAWNGVSRADRSLSNLLEAARQVLARVNMNSRAR